MFQLGRQTCQLDKLNLRKEKHGAQEVDAIDVPLTAIILTPGKFDQLMLEEGAHTRLFIHSGTAFEPAFKVLDGILRLAEPIGGVLFTFYIGRKVISFLDARLKDVTLYLQSGGNVLLEATLQCHPELDGTIDALQEKVHKQVEFEFRAENYGEAPAEQPAQDEKQADFVDGPLDKPEQKKRRGRPPRERADTHG